MSSQKIVSVPARKAKVISLIQSGRVHSQANLVDLLKKSGFVVTQATASRDLEDVGAFRGRNSLGEMVYQIATPEPKSHSRSESLPAELILSVESSGNLAVIHTPPGGAQLLASALDDASHHGLLQSIIGTIAGDDTVLVISRKASGGAELAKELGKLVTRRDAMQGKVKR